MGNRSRALSMVISKDTVNKRYNSNGVSNNNSLLVGSSSKRTPESIHVMKDVHNVLKYEWPNTIRTDANPIEMAVQLLDDSSVGLAHKTPEFDKIKLETNTVLRLVVNDQNESFNKAIGSYHLLVRNLDESLQECDDIKQLLESVTEDIHDKSDKLTELNEQSKRYADMIEILDAIDELNGVPQKVEHLIQERQLYSVYDVIASSYKLAEQYNLWSIPVLGTIKSYLENQSNNLFDMIIDELQNELFLKNLSDSDEFSQKNILESKNPKITSLRSLLLDSQNLENFVYNSANIDYMEIADFLNEDLDYFLLSHLLKLHERSIVLDKIGGSSGTAEDFALVFDSTKNDDMRSYHYMYRLLQTASKLSRLQQVVEILVGNIQLEMHSVIRNVTTEVKAANLANITKMAKFNLLDRSPKGSDPFGINSFHDFAVVILQDLFCTLFIKLGRVLQRHKVVSRVLELFDYTPINTGFGNDNRPLSLGGTEGDTTPNSAGYILNLAWNTIRKEVQALINSYIYDLNYVQPGLNEALPNLKSSKNLYKIMRTKEVFKFESHNFTSTSKLRNLEDMFPGYSLSEDAQGDVTANNNSPYIMSDSYNANVEMLTPLSMFNMRIIMEFFLVFVATSQSMAPDNASILFFQDFMKVTFMSYLNQKIDNEFIERVANTSQTEFNFKKELLTLDAGRVVVTDYDAKVSLRPQIRVIYKNALEFKKTLSTVCAIFNTAVVYRGSYNGAALETIDMFAHTYQRYYENLVTVLNVQVGHDNVVGQIDGYNDASTSVPEFELKLWLHIPALVDVSNKLLSLIHESEASAEQSKDLVAKEIEIMTTDRNLRLFEISNDDFMDDETFHQVCYLYLSTTWVLSWLPQVRRPAFKLTSSSSGNAGVTSYSEITNLKNDWSFLESGRFEHSGQNHVNESVSAVSNGNSSNKENGASNGSGHLNGLHSLSSILLALDDVHAERFEDNVTMLRKVQNEALLTLRYDIRLKCVYYVCRSFKSVDWFPTAEPGDADPFISKLSKEIFHLDNKLTELGILNKEIDLYFGLPEFLDTLLIKGSSLVRKINLFGIKRILLNIISLQQLLRNSVLNPEAVDFSRSSLYFEMFLVNEHDLMQKMKTNEYGFSKQEFKNLAKMIYSGKLADGDGPSFTKTKYNDLLKFVDLNVS